MGRHGRDVSHSSGSGEYEDYQRVGIFTKAINIYIGGKIEVTRGW